MAEYYPLLARAVAGMRQAPAAQRQAIYDRARNALLGQLRSMQPPVPDASIERESRALDEAIARVEADLVAPPPAAETPAPPRPATSAADPGPPRSAPDLRPEMAVAGGPATAGRSPAEQKDNAQPVKAPPAAVPPAPVVAPAPAAAPETAVTPETPAAPAPIPPAAPVATPAPVEPETLAAPAKPVPLQTLDADETAPPPLVAPLPRNTGGRPAAEALSRIVADRGRPAPVIRAVRGDEPLPEPARIDSPVTAGPAAPLPIAPRLEVPSFAAAMAAAAATDAADNSSRTPADLPAEAAVVREEGARPLAPRPSTPDRFNPRALILSAVALAVIAGIGLAAWRLRDRPEQIAKARAALLAAQQADQNNRAKISNRADNAGNPAGTATSTGASGTAGTAATGASSAGSSAGASSSGASSAGAVGSASSGAVASSAPEASGGAPTTPTPAAPADAPAVPAAALAPQPTASVNPGIPVAQRAAFLVDAPDEPSKIKTYEGTVVWTTENAAAAADQPLSRTVHAEVDVPGAALKLSLVFQKNYEAQFPASHTLELHFSLAPGNTLGPIKQISVPEMRKDDTPTGDPLIGLPVTITENYFLVGLSRGEPEARNLDLIKTRNWFDIPMMMASGKVAKITFEKGATGTRAIDEVLQSWQQ